MTLAPRLARLATTSLRLASISHSHARARALPPAVGCSHWVLCSRAYASKTKAKRAAAQANAELEISDEALELDFCDDVEIDADAAQVMEMRPETLDASFCDENELEDWNKGDEVEEGVFVSVPDFTHARHAKAAEAAANAPEKKEMPQRKVPTSIKHLNRLLGRHSVPDLPESELDEKFVRGRGPGGQAINKTNSSVCLTHIPTGIRVQSQPTRSREQNRYVARQILKDRLDLMRARGELPHPDGSFSDPKSPGEMSRKERLAAEARTWSKQELRWEKERRRKLNRKKKVNKRKKKGEEGGEEGEGGEDGEEERKE